MTPTTDDADKHDEHHAGQSKSLTLKKVLVRVVLVIIVVTLCGLGIYMFPFIF